MLSLLSLLLFCFLNTTRVSGYAEMALKYLFFLSSFFFFSFSFFQRMTSGAEEKCLAASSEAAVMAE